MCVCVRLQELEQFAGQVRSAMEKVEASNASQHLLDPVNSFQLLNRSALSSLIHPSLVSPAAGTPMAG